MRCIPLHLLDQGARERLNDPAFDLRFHSIGIDDEAAIMRDEKARRAHLPTLPVHLDFTHGGDVGSRVVIKHVREATPGNEIASTGFVVW